MNDTADKKPKLCPHRPEVSATSAFFRVFSREDEPPRCFAFDFLENPAGRDFARDVAAYFTGLVRLKQIENAAYKRHCMDSWQRRAAAHEVGHVIAALGCGFFDRIDYVAICNEGCGALEYKGEQTPFHFSDLQQTVPLLIVDAAGSMAELVLFGAEEVIGGIHELAYLIYAAQVIESNYQIPALVAFRAILAECERMIKLSRSGAKRLQEKLLRDGHASPADIAECFPMPVQSGYEAWMATARADTGTRYPALERMALVGAKLASCAGA